MNLGVRFLRHPTCLLALLIILACGCVRAPRMKTAPATQIRVDELAQHVEFLSSPSLKGRKCRSNESRSVRHYIRRHFEAAGLQSWPGSHGFDQSFSLGTNVVGVLRGSDRNLADEVILVCTHYDGPGVVNGRICPGAADGAAATAALLEIAQKLAAEGGHLRRSVAFAAFDCGEERYLGAFAFTCRKDFDPSRIAAVIDLNMLGRPLFGVVDNTLVAIGATDSPGVGQMVAQSAQAAGLRSIPVGSDLAGPISDSFAFQQWPISCLVLTNGLYFDYYKPTDTPEKIDYDLLTRVTSATAHTISELASRDTIDQANRPEQADREELQGIATVLEEIREKAAVNDLTAGEIQMLDRQANRARQLLASDSYTLKDRDRLIASLLEQGAPSAIRFLREPPKPDPRTVINARQMAGFMRLQQFFAKHDAFASRGLQQVVRHFTEGWSLFRLLGGYTYSGCDIRDDEIAYQQQESGLHRLSVFYPHMTIQASLSGRKMDVTWSIMDFRGEPGEVVDFCLLTWSSRQDGCLDEVMPRVLREVTGRQLGSRYEEWLDWRMRQTGARGEAGWLQSLWQSRNPLLLKALFARSAGGNRVDAPADRLVEIIADATIRADVRADAIRALPAGVGSDGLLVLANLLADRTPAFQYSELPAFDRSFPFYDNTIVQLARRFPEPHERLTLGQVAHRRLVALTGQDLGLEPRRYREWIEQRKQG